MTSDVHVKVSASNIYPFGFRINIHDPRVPHLWPEARRHTQQVKRRYGAPIPGMCDEVVEQGLDRWNLRNLPRETEIEEPRALPAKVRHPHAKHGTLARLHGRFSRTLPVIAVTRHGSGCRAPVTVGHEKVSGPTADPKLKQGKASATSRNSKNNQQSCTIQYSTQNRWRGILSVVNPWLWVLCYSSHDSCKCRC